MDKGMMTLVLAAVSTLLVAHEVLPLWVHLTGGLLGCCWMAYRYACYLKWEERRQTKKKAAPNGNSEAANNK